MHASTKTTGFPLLKTGTLAAAALCTSLLAPGLQAHPGVSSADDGRPEARMGQHAQRHAGQGAAGAHTPRAGMNRQHQHERLASAEPGKGPMGAAGPGGQTGGRGHQGPGARHGQGAHGHGKGPHGMGQPATPAAPATPAS